MSFLQSECGKQRSRGQPNKSPLSFLLLFGLRRSSRSASRVAPEVSFPLSGLAGGIGGGKTPFPQPQELYRMWLSKHAAVRLQLVKEKYLTELKSIVKKKKKKEAAKFPVNMFLKKLFLASLSSCLVRL